MKLAIYKIDAFTDQLLGGNQAAVLPLSQWLADELMQQIACENNLPITVFFVPNDHDVIHFESQTSKLTAAISGDWVTLNFPVDECKVAVPPPALLESFGTTIIEGDYMVVLGSEQELVDLDVNMIVLSTIPARDIIVTAPGTDVDFVSRFFASQSGIDEDPVTGSTHTTLVPYWAEKFSKTMLIAKQLSKRGGYLACELVRDMVNIGEQGRVYLMGEVEV